MKYSGGRWAARLGAEQGDTEARKRLDAIG